MKEISAETWQIIQKMFPPEHHEEAAQFLASECGNNLPFLENADELGLERVHFAVLKLSNGNLSGLLRAIEDAQKDWRDTLMGAGFGYDVIEHNRWAKEYLT
jgi:hypothetical protein